MKHNANDPNTPVELTEAEQAKVGGALNPQPLPPRWQQLNPDPVPWVEANPPPVPW